MKEEMKDNVKKKKKKIVVGDRMRRKLWRGSGREKSISRR